MYGLDSSTRLDSLVGHALIQIAFSPFQLILRFKDQAATDRSQKSYASISIQAICRVHSQDGQIPAEWKPEREGETYEPCDLRPLATCLKHQIVECLVPRDGSLWLRLDNDKRLEMLDDNREFESYQITIGDRLIVV
jgi:hypothetical protein